MTEESFSVRLKLELSKIRAKTVNARQAVIAGMFAGSAERNADGPALSIKVIPEIKSGICELLRLEGIDYCTDGLRIEVAGDMQCVFAELFGQCFTESGLKLLPGDEAFAAGFLRGAFLATGYCSDPAKNYRIEFHISNDRITELVCLMLQNWKIDPVVKNRSDFSAVYFKAGDMVSDFLGHTGAAHSMLEFEDIRARKTVNGDVCRAVNCDEGNSKRQAEAGVRRNELIKKLMMSSFAGKLTPELTEAAKAHLANPGASIAELGAMMNPPIGKSGMNHRLKKLLELAESHD